ncbi:MAG: aminotransferase class I/II-fold pyridoxal phosphate-dependent enzyme [Sphaerochaetaceae bacterium]|nr:aminotransferase class I/II-fold pyridoxal phosphate-dependent enzyme [Sphaerochaetaceae bacterium]
MYDFEKHIDRSNTSSIKWSKEAIKGICGNEEALPFWVADMDLPTSKAIHNAMMKSAIFGVAGYSDHPLLQSSFISFAKRRHDWKIDSESVTYVQGMLHGIALAMQTFTEKNDGVLIMYPTYAPFEMMAKNNERKVIEYDLGYKDGLFYLDRERYKEESKDAKLIMLCSPHNPSGLVFSTEELAFILSLAKERDQLVFSDEIHADLTHTGIEHTPLGKVNEKIGAKVITFMAPSKTFNIAGEHFAEAIFSDKNMLATFKREQDKLYVNAPGFFIGEMAESAYSDSDEENRELCEHLRKNASFIRNYLETELPEIKLVNANASFIAFLDCSSIVEKVREDKKSNPELYDKENNLLAHFFGSRAGICMNDGTWFGAKYSSFVRFNYGTSQEMVKLALDKMKMAVRALY